MVPARGVIADFRIGIVISSGLRKPAIELFGEHAHLNVIEAPS
jgi:hypothetical protein